MIELPEPACVYCHGAARLYEKNAYHKYAKGYGPFDIYVCRQCGSLFTYPVPASEKVKALYAGFDKGMYERITELRTQYPLTTWYRQCVDRMRKALGDDRADLAWIDVGAGDGIMGTLMKEAFPLSRGVAADFHDRPGRLVNSDVQWVTADLNNDFSAIGQFDLVFAITVFEHMLDPGHFLASMLSLVKPGGVLYFNCPRADCNAFRLMGRKWPYYLPGEHISIPSMQGLDTLAKRTFGVNAMQYSIRIDPVIMPYPLGYYAGYFLGTKKKLPFDFDLYIPTGLLECVIHRQN